MQSADVGGTLIMLAIYTVTDPPKVMRWLPRIATAHVDGMWGDSDGYRALLSLFVQGYAILNLPESLPDSHIPTVLQLAAIHELGITANYPECEMCGDPALNGDVVIEVDSRTGARSISFRHPRCTLHYMIVVEDTDGKKASQMSFWLVDELRKRG